ncbi:hypothetical protein ESCO47_00131 [Escherichia phage vB_EcoM_ESCO47]|nr:hypothetical protein ESCO47_00131 [Escherichia phage vB_EcoM_ESCO47]
MGTVFYQIWKLTNKESRKLIFFFLAVDVLVWNLVIVPLAATQAIILPQVELQHILSIIKAIGVNLHA